MGIYRKKLLMITPRPYQINSVDCVAKLIRDGHKRIVFQMATGGGKTVSFTYLTQRFLKIATGNILILVNREELLYQASNTFKKFGIEVDILDAKKKFRDYSKNICISMVETASRRLAKSKFFYGKVDLVIIDECHIGNFRKIYEYYPESYFIGFSATPLSSSKKFPLNDFYTDIVCSIDIDELIEINALVPNVTYTVKGIDKAGFGVRNGEYDEASMGKEFGKVRNIQNVVKAHEKHSLGLKNIIFNVNLEHNTLVNKAFLDAGYQAKELTGKSKDRKEILEWFKNTPDAIINNVGVATTGFDEPSIRTVTINRSTMSMPLWLQMTGRGARPYQDKNHFTILDLGGNAMAHGDWSSKRDWKQLFRFPVRSSGGGVAPVKECKGCEAIIAAGATICKYCGAEQARKEIGYDIEPLRLEKLDVHRIVENVKLNKHSKYSALHILKNKIINEFKNQYNSDILQEEAYEMIHNVYQSKVKEWCKIEGKRYNQWHKDTSKEWLNSELLKKYKLTFNII